MISLKKFFHIDLNLKKMYTKYARQKAPKFT